MVKPFNQIAGQNLVVKPVFAGQGPAIRLTFKIALLALSTGSTANAQLPPGALQQLDTAIGQRVEATAVFGTQSIASRAGLGWTLDDATGHIYKIPWKTELEDP